jgi:hypothetical protein
MKVMFNFLLFFLLKAGIRWDNYLVADYLKIAILIQDCWRVDRFGGSFCQKAD